VDVQESCKWEKVDVGGDRGMKDYGGAGAKGREGRAGGGGG